LYTLRFTTTALYARRLHLAACAPPRLPSRTSASCTGGGPLSPLPPPHLTCTVARISSRFAAHYLSYPAAPAYCTPAAPHHGSVFCRAYVTAVTCSWSCRHTSLPLPLPRFVALILPTPAAAAAYLPATASALGCISPCSPPCRISHRYWIATLTNTAPYLFRVTGRAYLHTYLYTSLRFTQGSFRRICLGAFVGTPPCLRTLRLGTGGRVISLACCFAFGNSRVTLRLFWTHHTLRTAPHHHTSTSVCAFSAAAPRTRTSPHSSPTTPPYPSLLVVWLPSLYFTPALRFLPLTFPPVTTCQLDCTRFSGFHPHLAVTFDLLPVRYRSHTLS